MRGVLLRGKTSEIGRFGNIFETNTVLTHFYKKKRNSYILYSIPEINCLHIPMVDWHGI